MQDVARIVLAVDTEHLAQDVVDYLDRSGRARVVDTVRDPDAVATVIEREHPDAVIGSTSLVRRSHLNGSAFLAVATEESIRVLREAVDAGAKGFFLWPADRSGLLAAAAGTSRPMGVSGERRASVIAVQAPRGGAGGTFVATHLAAAMARRGADPILVDADPDFADLTWALGVREPSEIRTLRDLEPVDDEVAEDHVRNVLWSHPSGVRALLWPPDPTVQDRALRIGRIIEVCRGIAGAVVVHLPRSFDPVVHEVLTSDARTLFVITLDVLALRDAKRALAALAPKRWDLVVNRAGRGLVAPQDVERVFGRPPIAVLPTDRHVPAIQDRGELLPPRGRLGRAVDRLARTLVGDAS